MNDMWLKLWEIAAAREHDQTKPTLIEPTEDPFEVILAWPDGSKALVHWHEGDWRFSDSLNTSPCDIGARDTF